MAKEEKPLPENTVLKIAENANIIIHNSKGSIDIPVYVDRTEQVMNPKGLIRFHIPDGVEIGITVEIPLKDNLTDKNINLEDAMKMMQTSNNIVREAYGCTATIENHICNGNQIVIKGKYSNRR